MAAHACGEWHPDPAARHLFRLEPELEDRKVEILEGLEGTSRAALGPNSLLQNGDPVRVLSPGPSGR